MRVCAWFIFYLTRELLTISETWWLVAGGWWLVAGGWWLVRSWICAIQPDESFSVSLLRIHQRKSRRDRLHLKHCSGEWLFPFVDMPW